MQPRAVTPLNQSQEIPERTDSLPAFITVAPVIELAVAQTWRELSFIISTRRTHPWQTILF